MLCVLCCHHQYFLARLFGHFLFLETCTSIQQDLITICVVPSVPQQKFVLNGLKISAESVIVMSSSVSLNVKII